MKFILEGDIEHCTQCPFKEYMFEQGTCGDICGLLIHEPYPQLIPREGILTKCPFKKNEKIIWKKA